MLLLLTLFALLFLPLQYSPSSHPALEDSTTTRVPDVEYPALDGLFHDGVAVPGFAASDFIGNVTIVSAFASWCRPCSDQASFLAQLGGDDRIAMVGIVISDRDPDALAFLATHDIRYDAVGVDPTGRVSIAWSVYGVPETFLVDRNGVIRYKLIGPMFEGNFATVVAEIEAILAEQPAGATPAPAATPPA